MVKYLIIDDVFDQWDGYNLYLKEHQKVNQDSIPLKNLVSHEKNMHIRGGYNEIKVHLKEILETDELSLLITDISLGGQDNSTDPRIWITTLLQELIKESEIIKKILERRGLGLILVTQHHSNILNRIIQDNQNFLNQYFPSTWRYISSEEFEDSIVDSVEDLSKYFEELNGRWFHIQNRDEFFHKIGLESKYFTSNEDDKILKLNLSQIVSLEILNTHSLITYVEENTLKTFLTSDFKRHDEDLFSDLKDDFGITNLSAFGRNDLPDAFYPENEYFLQIRARNPLSFINNSIDWRIENSGHGRLLEYMGKVLKCSFPSLNDHFNS